MKTQANERTFQGILLNTIAEIITENKELNFSQVTQEENIGVGKQSRFADGLLYSSVDKKNITLFELKNNKWDATDDELVEAAQIKAQNVGFDFFVTGNPRQLAIYKTFEKGKNIQERRIEIFTISNIRNDAEVLTQSYKSHITNRLKIFLLKLSNLVHGIIEIVYDNINNLYINRLSAYILEASYNMWDVMINKIDSDTKFKNRIKDYLQNQDIFNLNKNLDNEDIYKLCQLANYMLYLKILFYSNLQRNVPSLKLKPLLIPDESEELNNTLQRRFADVLQHDYEMIFTPSVIDEFKFKNDYIPQLQRNTESIKTLNFEDLNADIIGAIYNTLLDNQEQHDRGQHFTNTNEVDIINAFCINEKTRFVTDTSCGAGTFLVRAYQFLKYYNPQFTHEQLIEHLWGIEIATFPAFLAVMNLCLLNIKAIENYPIIIRSDFSKIKTNHLYSGYFLNASKDLEVTMLDNRTKKVKLPMFDACVGNPPYIRQELIEDKKLWNDLANNEHGIKKINQQSDFYVYYLMHTASFLKNGGRFGYVISHTWLDTLFGTGLQKFLLDNFKIIAIIDNKIKRSFETALVYTVILVLEKCDNQTERENNLVRFVRIYKDYEDLIGGTWANDRLEKVNNFAKKIENTRKSTENNNYKIFVINQKTLELQSTIDKKYENGNWGAKFLRSPKIYNKIIEIAFSKLEKVSNIVDVKYGIKSGCNEYFYIKDETNNLEKLTDKDYEQKMGFTRKEHGLQEHKLVKISDITNVKRGFTTGSNEFYYVEDKTKDLEKLTDQNYEQKTGFTRKEHKNYWEKFGHFYSEMNNQHYDIERIYLQPLFKSQREAVNLDVDFENLKYFVIFCDTEKSILKKQKTKILKYIEDAELLNINKRPTMTGRDLWYNLKKSAVIGDFIFPSVIGEKFRLIDNRKSQVLCDKVNFVIEIKEDYKKYADELFLILNSTLFRFFIDLFSQQMATGVSAADVNVLEKTLIPNPELLLAYKKELDEIYKSFKSREQLSIFEEVKQADRRRLDEIIFEAIGLEKSDVDQLYEATCNYVSKRKEKNESVENVKKKQQFSFDEAIVFVKERFTEINTYEKLIENLESNIYNIPNGKPKYPKVKNGNGSMFATYEVFFKDNNETITINFENQTQVELFKFLNSEFDIKACELKLPTKEEDCRKTYLALNKDYINYGEQIKNLLKSHRISINLQTVYKKLVFENLD